MPVALTFFMLIIVTEPHSCSSSTESVPSRCSTSCQRDCLAKQGRETAGTVALLCFPVRLLF